MARTPDYLRLRLQHWAQLDVSIYSLLNLHLLSSFDQWIGIPGTRAPKPAVFWAIGEKAQPR